VIDTWVDETTRLGENHAWVQVFENRGSVMGASNPHPHGQIWATSEMPVEADRELTTQRRHLARSGQRMLLEYAVAERGGPRTVVDGEEWLVVVPFWATWPFETLVLPLRPVERLPDLTETRRDSLAETTARLLSAYDRVFETPFPYSMGWHQAPFGSSPDDGWQLHAHYYPPLLRSASVRKFMVGYELLAEPQRDLSPEAAAERLRSAMASARPAPD
jgi:UDPglucose--hexose-1-phosphate uridylyltransferase